jgi:very-short-patch-repair endonuclease
MTDPSRYTRSLRFWTALKPKVRKMRHEPTAGEEMLWQRLRNRQLGGCKFRGQDPIDRFVADFCCPQRTLVVEVDGDVHDNKEIEDQVRSEFLEGLGFRVMQFSNARVLSACDSVLAEIAAAIGVDVASPRDSFTAHRNKTPPLRHGGEGDGG